MRRRLRQQLCSGVDEEVEPGEVRRDQRELFAQQRLWQAQRPDHGEPVGFDVDEHEAPGARDRCYADTRMRLVAPRS